MPHVLEPAPTGRAKCRGCGGPIAKGELRFGERLPSSFGEGEMTLWFHPPCAAYKRPESLLQALGETPEKPPGAESWEHMARDFSSHRRLPRIDGAERSPSGQAKCRSCKQSIERGTWRIRLVFFEAGRFLPGGFVHLGCRLAYFERDDVQEAVLHFSANLGDEERAALLHSFATDPLRPGEASES